MKAKNENRCLMLMKVVILFITCHLSLVAVYAQERSLLDSLKYCAEFQATLATGDHNPLWLNANKYGLSSLKKANGYLRGRVERPLTLDNGRKWGVGYGLDVAIAAGFTSTFIVQQAYIEGRWLKGTLTVGAKEQPMELKNLELSTGSQTLGINARPVPQVRMALPDYWTIPGTKNWLALKGHIAFGKTSDDGWQKDFTSQQHKYTEGALYHSKSGFLKIGNPDKVLISLELGIEMACQFGGTSYRFRSDGTPDDVVHQQGGIKGMLKALIPAGSDAVDDLYTGGAGNGVGSWLGRFNFDCDEWGFSLYAAHFFEDHSAMFLMDYDGYGEGPEWNVKKKHRYFLYALNDILVGFDLRLKDARWVDNVLVELLFSKYQSGPIYHDHDEVVSDHLGGQDNYYNHSIYTGWQHWGQVMGNPLFLSPLYNTDQNIEVKNNRSKAYHVGLSGSPYSRFHYRLLGTYLKGYGTYDTPYPDPRKTVSLLAEACYSFPSTSSFGGWSVKGALGVDLGKLMGNNWGIQMTLAKNGILRLNKK